MKQPEFVFNDEGSNGWAIYEACYIEGDAIKNMHIVEGKVRRDEKGQVWFTPNSRRVTMCGTQYLKECRRCCWLVTQDASEIRSEVARLENGTSEVCGRCVACFYADGK